MKKEFPRFWYESNACWGYVNSFEELEEKFRLQLKENNGIDNVKQFLEQSIKAKHSNSFGTMREHVGPKSLSDLLKENNLLDEFLKITNEVFCNNDFSNF